MNALIASLEDTAKLAFELMERAAGIDRKLSLADGREPECELGEIVRLRAQLSKNEKLISEVKNDRNCADIDSFRKDWRSLLRTLKPTIGDDYRASDDADDKTPGMCVTIGFTPAVEDKPASWSYQTGDNSFTGGAYGHPHWAVLHLYRRSNCDELAKEAADEIKELIYV